MKRLYQYRTLEIDELRRIWRRRLQECRDDGKAAQMGIYCCPASVADPEHCPDHPWENVALPLDVLLDAFGLTPDDISTKGVNKQTHAAAAASFAASHALPADQH